MRYLMEKWIIKSIKPIDIGCESSILLGSPDYLVREAMSLLVPVWIIMWSLYFPASLIYLLFKKYSRS